MAQDYQKFFPYDSVRPEQDRAIQFVLDSFLNKGKRYCVLELGTGCGKSGVAIAVARTMRYLREKGEDPPIWKERLGPDGEIVSRAAKPGCYVITTQKALQEQYVDDFGHSKGPLCTIKSSANYTCSHKPMKGQSCGESLRMVRHEPQGTRFFNNCALNCVYKSEKKVFLNSPEGVTNFPYFLAETYYSGKLEPRELLVIDEAHNVEEQLSKFVEISFSENFAKNVLKVRMPPINTQRQAIKWIEDEYIPKLAKKKIHVQSMFDKFKGLKSKLNEMQSAAKQYEMMDKHLCKVNRFLEHHVADNWVMNINHADSGGRRIEFKPVDVGPFTESHLFRNGERILLMSATILDKDAYCQSLGIDPAEVEFLSIGSPFPVENRPVFYTPVGSMARASLDDSLPKLVRQIEEIMTIHPDVKGLIHAHTFKIANYIKNNIRSKRLLIHNSENREEVLQKHYEGSEPTILISPSMTEGIDMKGDRSRFQVICKIPYPYLGDKVIKKRMNRHRWWYPYATSKVIVQALGRSVRSNDDWAVTYILDSDWSRFYGRNKTMFPPDFEKLLQ